MSGTYSRKQLFKSSSTVCGIIESDSLEPFKLQCTSLISYATNHQSRKFIDTVMQLKSRTSSKNSILFDCCKYGSINILSYLIQECKTHNINLLKKALCLISKPRSNTLLMTCVIANKKEEREDIKLRKFLCLNLLLETMVDILNNKKFREIVNHRNYHSMHFITLSSKYNDINSLKLIFYYCGLKSTRTTTRNIIDKKSIMEKEHNTTKSNKFKNGMYYAKFNKNLEMKRFFLNMFNNNGNYINKNMVDCLILQSCSATFSPCQSFLNRIDDSNSNGNNNGNNSVNNNNTNSVYLPTTNVSGKTSSVMVDNHDRDCINQNRAKNKNDKNKIKKEKQKNKNKNKKMQMALSATAATPSPSLDVDDENNVIKSTITEKNKKEVIPIEGEHNDNSTLVVYRQTNNNETITPKLAPKYRIFSFKFGTMEVIETNILLFLHWNDGLKFRQINKYFNKLIKEQLYDFFIFDSIKTSLYVIAQRAQRIKDKIDSKKHDKENGSHLFISRCIKNEMFEQFIYILKKNTFCQCNDNKTIDEFMNRLEERCNAFLTCRRLAKKYRDGQMFVRKTDFFNRSQYDECQAVYARWQDNTDTSGNTTTTTTTTTTANTKCRENIKRFINYMNDIINNIKKWDEKLFTNASDHWRASKKIDKYYNDLFDVFFYLTCHVPDESERKKYKADPSFRLHETKWRYFAETICTWLLIAFMDRLPLSRPFIGSFKGKKSSNDYHTDFGGHSFLEFFLELKTHVVNRIDFLPLYNYFEAMYDEEYAFIFNYGMPVAVFRQMQCVYFHMYVGSFRINFILSSFFVTNSKRLNNRSTFIRSLFMHKSDKLYNKIGNGHAKQDCTLNRLTFLFLKDIRPFGTLKCKNGVYHEFNFAPWVEFRSAVKGDIRENTPFDLDALGDKLLDAIEKVKLEYSEAAQQYENDEQFHDGLYHHCESLFESIKCRFSSNFDYENVNRETFVSNINSLIKQTQKQKQRQNIL